MAKVIGYYAALYWWEEAPPPGIPVPTHVKPVGVNDNFPFDGGGRGIGLTAPTSQGRRAHTPMCTAFQEMSPGGVPRCEDVNTPQAGDVSEAGGDHPVHV